MTTDPLRILMVAPTPYFADRGCHVRIFEEARALVRRGHEVRIVTYHLGRDVGGIPTVRIPAVPWYRRLSAGPSWQKPFLDILLFITLAQEIRRFSPTILYAHLHEGAFVSIPLSSLWRLPLLFDCQGSLTGEMLDHRFVRKGSLLERFFAEIEGWINRNAGVIVTSSTPLARSLVEGWGVPPERVVPLPDGVDTDRFTPGDRTAARRELSLPPDLPVLAYLGVMNRYQGVDLLLEAMGILKERGVEVHLLLMGYPDQPYREMTSRLGLSRLVTVTGRVPYDDAPRLLSAADFAVSPKLSRTEANGKLLNYLACGLPVVCFDTPVNREILGEEGILVPYGDLAGLADGIARLARDGELRRRLGEGARRRAVERHGWDARGEELERIIRQAVS